jgi:hypothetical protein
MDEDLSSRAAAEHAREYGYTCPVVLDGGRVLVRRAGTPVTHPVGCFISPLSSKDPSP